MSCLIRVMSAGVNRPDVQQRLGLYPPPPGASPLLGLEVAGEVAAVNDAAGWKPGDKVCALTNGGGYAEYCTAPASQCLPWPQGYDAIRAGALPENYFTVLGQPLRPRSPRPWREHSHPRRHQRHRRNRNPARARIRQPRLCHSRQPRKMRRLPPLGPQTAAINYKAADFALSIREFTTGAGVNVVLDMVGGPYIARNLRSLAMDGRLVLIAFLGGPKVEDLDLTSIMDPAPDRHRQHHAPAHRRAKSCNRRGVARKGLARPGRRPAAARWCTRCSR